MKVKITVPGNPVPYLRMTQGQIRLFHVPVSRISAGALAVRKRIERYLRYKHMVYSLSLGRGINRSPEKAYLNVMIYFSSKKHGDPENIRKGIQDAIFKNDKYVAGSVDFDYDPENPRVEVEIQEKEEK